MADSKLQMYVNILYGREKDWDPWYWFDMVCNADGTMKKGRRRQ